MTNLTSNKEIEAILFGVILGDEHTNRNTPSVHPAWHDKHLSVSEAHQAIVTLLVKAREAQIHDDFQLVAGNGDFDDKTLITWEEHQLRQLTPKEKSGE